MCILREGTELTHLLGVVWICLGIERPRLGDVFGSWKGLAGVRCSTKLSLNYESSASGAGSQVTIRAYHSDADQEVGITMKSSSAGTRALEPDAPTECRLELKH